MIYAHLWQQVCNLQENMIWMFDGQYSLYFFKVCVHAKFPLCNILPVLLYIASKHGILIHLYADDTQLYIKLSAKDIVNAKSRLLACFSDIQAWCASMHLKLNASKTELIWFNRLLTPATDIPHTVLNLGPDCSIKPTDVVRDLGVLLDNTLSL